MEMVSLWLTQKDARRKRILRHWNFSAAGWSSSKTLTENLIDTELVQQTFPLTEKGLFFKEMYWSMPLNYSSSPTAHPELLFDTKTNFNMFAIFSKTRPKKNGDWLTKNQLSTLNSYILNK